MLARVPRHDPMVRGSIGRGLAAVVRAPPRMVSFGRGSTAVVRAPRRAWFNWEGVGRVDSRPPFAHARVAGFKVVLLA